MQAEASEVRRRMYQTAEFRAEMVERLNFGTDRVTLPLDALLQANVIPSELDDPTEALAVEGTKILLSICSQVRKASAMATVAERIGSMTLQAELGTPRKKWSTAGFFAADVAMLLRKFWAVGRTGSAIPTLGVSVLWSDPQGQGTVRHDRRMAAGQAAAEEDLLFGDAAISTRARRRVGLHPVADRGRHVRFAAPAAGIRRTPPRRRRRHRRGPVEPLRLYAQRLF
ncbi:hypothetical protein ACVWZK_003073 [Bradyrhizobium sp. GM0.4]